MENKSSKLKYGYGDLIKIKGENNIYKIISGYYEESFEEDDQMESYHYTAKNIKTGELIDFMSLDEIELPSIEETTQATGQVSLTPQLQPLTKKEIDFLLDLYNKYISCHELFESLDVKTDYLSMSKEVLKYLEDNTN
jgi:hypothetical protein